MKAGACAAEVAYHLDCLEAWVFAWPCRYDKTTAHDHGERALHRIPQPGLHRLAEHEFDGQRLLAPHDAAVGEARLIARPISA